MTKPDDRAQDAHPEAMPNDELLDGEEPPEEVRDPEGDEEGIRREARAKKAGHDHVPDKAEDAGEHRGHPHHPRRPDDPRIFGTVLIRHVKIS